jgi:SET domain-containing protein
MTLAQQYVSRIRHEGLIKGDAGEKGFGVFTTRSFRKGEYLCEYEGKYRESLIDDDSEGNYLYHFKVGKLYCRLLLAFALFNSQYPPAEIVAYIS